MQVATANNFELLKGWIASNPNRHTHLDMPQQDAEPPSNLPGSPRDWLEFNVNPVGPTAALYFLKDPVFSQAASGLRNQMLLEKQSELAEKLDSDMRSGKLMRMRRKMHEWLATAPSRLTQETLDDVWEILCTVNDIQTICLEDRVESGELHVSFSPAVNLWRPEIPTHVVTRNLSKVWVYVGRPQNLRKSFIKWLSDMEEAGAKIHYPAMEGSKVEMVEFLEVLPSWKESMRKMKKDELAPLAGRAKTIDMFNEWQVLSPQMQLFCEDEM